MVALLFSATAWGVERPDWHDAPDHEITIEVIEQQMKYSPSQFMVTPNSKVKLIFNNTDEMPHNLLIGQPGKDTAKVLGLAALALGEEGEAKGWVPEGHGKLLFNTPMVLPGESYDLYFVAPEKVGNYTMVCTFPGHWMIMNGQMRLLSVIPGIKEIEMSYYEGSFDSMPDFSKLKPVLKKRIPGKYMDIGEAPRDEAMAVVFTGRLSLAKSGQHSFSLFGDDGARLEIDGKVLLDRTPDLVSTHSNTKGQFELSAGEHQLRLSYFNQSGNRWLDLHWKGPSLGRQSLTSPRYEEREAVQSEPLEVAEQAIVTRGFMDEGLARPLAVALPGGVNYVFDTATGSVAYGWLGAYLDILGSVQARGGRAMRILGTRFEVGDTGFPIRFGSPRAKTHWRYNGFRTIGDTPVILLEADGHEIELTVTGEPDRARLHYRYVIDRPEQDVYFEVDPSGLDFESSVGSWKQGVLHIPANQASRFTITVGR